MRNRSILRSFISTSSRRAIFPAICIGLVLGTLATVVPVSAEDDARGEARITPFAGMYVPTRNDFKTAEADIKRNSSFVSGAQLTWYPKSLFGLELVGAYTPASTEIAGATVNEERGLAVFLASARLLVGLSPAVSPVSLFAKAGPAYIRRGVNVTRGAFEDRAEAELGGVVGLGAQLPFTRTVGLRMDAEDYIYQGFGGGNETQNDLVISAGVAFGF